MNEIAILFIAVLLTLVEATMPKPRSRLPSTVAIIAIVVLLVIAYLQWKQPNIIPENYLLWIMVALLVVPILLTLYVCWREKLGVVLGKLNEENRHRVESIINILQNIYSNEKKMAEAISSTLSAENIRRINMELCNTLGLRYFNKILSSEAKFSFIEILKTILFIFWVFFVFLALMFSRLFPYFVREFQFLVVAAIPDIIGIGLNSIKDTDKDLNQLLKQKLDESTRWFRTDESVNVIQKCLKYSHATNNLYLIKLANADTVEAIDTRLLRLYRNSTRGNFDHLMKQRFEEVAKVISKELEE